MASLRFITICIFLDIATFSVSVQPPDYLSRARIVPKVAPPAQADATSESDKNAGQPMSSSRCCKTGEKAAKAGMYCNYDIYAVVRAPYYVHRAKVEMNGEERPHAGGYKTLALQIAKCFHHKHIFEKCCNHRANFLLAMKLCREVTDPVVKRECRKKNRNKYGY